MKKIFTLWLLLTFAITLFGCKEKHVYENGEVYVYNWGEYIDPEVIDMFEEEYDIKVIYDMFETNEEMYPIIEKGTVIYDVICPSEYMIQKMIDNNLLQELDKSKIPNLSNMNREQMNFMSQVDKGNKYAVPYLGGTVGILYNKTLLDEKNLPYPKSWADLWNEEYKGEILMQNSVRDAFMVSLKKNGYSMNSKNEYEINIAKNDLVSQKPLVQAYVVDQVRDKMINGEAMLGVIYSGEVLYVQSETEGTYEYKYVLPTEGTNVWLDGFVIPKNSKNVDNAHKWIDFLCRADIAKLNTEFVTYETPNDAAYALLDDEYKLEGDIVEDYTKNNNEIFEYLGENIDALYNDKWKEIKSE